jgi:hypothetical protein
MNYSLGNTLSRGGSLNADGLSLNLQFAADKTLTARKGPTPTFTRASTATFVGSDGLIQSAAINQARFDHNPVTLACKGLLIEESRTNLVFPSATLTTQTRTVTAVAHTLSFYGTGTVVLSGVAIATVIGTGAYPTRTTLTFTPTAGSLILTVTGSVTDAQLEAGAFATSYIPTTTASVVRSVDVCSITGAAFTGFYNQSEGTIVGSGLTNQPTTNAGPELFKSSDGTNNNRIQIGMTNFPTQAVRPFIVSGGTSTYSNTNGTATVGVERKVGTAYKTNDAISAFNGTLGTLDTTVTPPTNCNTALLFSGLGSGTISSLRYFKKRLSDAKLQTLTTL